MMPSRDPLREPRLHTSSRFRDAAVDFATKDASTPQRPTALVPRFH